MVRARGGCLVHSCWCLVGNRGGGDCQCNRTHYTPAHLEVTALLLQLFVQLQCEYYVTQLGQGVGTVGTAGHSNQQPQKQS